MKKFIVTISFQVGLYILQFLLVPLIITDTIGNDAYRFTIIFILTTVVLSFIGMILLNTSLIFWIIGIIFYFLLINFYHPDEVYGIGAGIFSVPLFEIIILTIVVLITQTIVWVVVNWIKRILKKTKKPL